MAESGQAASGIKGLIVAGTASGTGKTTVTLAALRALVRRGLSVSSGKVGPDYIDPEFHRAATGRPCTNLDTWAMAGGTLRRLIARASENSSRILIEGVMGLFDGAGAGGGSTADVAEYFDIPVALVVDVSGQSASAAAVVEGFRNFRPGVEVRAAVLNRVASSRHEKMCRAALDDIGCPVVAALPHHPELIKESRYLGLKQAEEIPDLENLLEKAADWFEAHTDWELFLSLFQDVKALGDDASGWGIKPPGSRVAIARDVAFRFFYTHLAAAWEEHGARLSFFSPLADEGPDPDADAVFLPGGYPELHAGSLSRNGNFLEGLRRAARRSVPVYGECGGYMVLGESLRDQSGQAYPMAGLLPLKAAIDRPKRRLGYRKLILMQDALGEASGVRLRGHEFHYASIEEAGAYSGSLKPLFDVRDSGGEALGPAGHVLGSVAGSFVHLIDQAS